MASGKIKGITVEIGGDTTKLGQAIADSEKKSRALSGELKDVNRLLKFDSNNIELVAQKQNILTEAIDESRKKLDTLKEAEAQIAKQFELGEIGEDQFRAFQREIIQTESKINGMTQELKKLNGELDDTEEESKDASQGFTVMKGAIADLIADGVSKLAESIKNCMSEVVVETESAYDSFQAKTGTATDAMEEFRDVIDDLYKNNYGESFDDIASAMAEIKQQTNETNPDKLKELTQNAIALRDTFDFDIKESMRAVNMLTEQFGITGEEAFNLIIQGAQKGLDKNGDLLDTINEYSVHYKQLGFTSEEFFNSLTNGTESGTFSVDKLGDAMKEFGIRVKDNSDSTYEALEGLGFGAENMMDKILSGGDTAKKAFRDITKALLNLDDPLSQNVYGVSLFGTMWEDLGIEGVKALTDTTGAMDRTKKSMEEINAIKYDNIGAKFEQLGRTVKMDLIAPTAEKLLPTLEKIVDYSINNSDKIVDKIKLIGVTLGTVFVVNKVATFTQSIVTMVQTYQKVQKAIESADKAQKLFNLTQSATPWGAIALAIGAVVAGIAVYKSATKKATDETTKAYKEIEEFNKKSREQKKAYDEMVEARDKSSQGVEAEFGYYKNLTDELSNIVDENGKVKKGYEDRANVITSILSKTLGEEISTDKLVADGKQKVIDKINELLIAKRAEAQLSAYEQSYTEAIQNSNNALNEYTKAEANHKKISDDLVKAKKQLESAQKNYDNATDPRTRQMYKQQLDEEKRTVEDLTKSEKEESKTVKDKQDVYLGYVTTIQNYEGVTSAIIEGDSAKINDALNLLINDFITAENGTKTSLENQVKNAKTTLENLKTALANGSPGVTQQMVDNAQDMVTKAEAELNKLTSKGSKAGKDGGKATADGLKSKKQDVKNSAKEVTDEVKKEFAKTPDNAKNAGIKTGKAKADGIKSKAGDVKNSSKFLADSAGKELDKTKEKGKTAGENAGSATASGIKSKEGSVKTASRGIATATGNELDKAKTSAKKAGENATTSHAKGMTGKKSTVTTAGKTVATAGNTGLKSIKTSGSGQNFTLGFARGITDQSALSSVNLSVSTLASNALSWLRQKIGEASPAKKVKPSGSNFTRGFAVGINDAIGEAEKAVENLTDSSIGTLDESMSDKMSTIRDSVKAITGAIVEESEYKAKRFDRAMKKIDALYAVGAYTEAEYYTELEKARNAYLTAKSDKWIEATKKIYDYESKIHEEQKKQFEERKKLYEDHESEIIDFYDNFTDYAQSKLDSLDSAHANVASKISDFGNLLNEVTINAGDEFISYKTLADLDAQNNELREYADLLLQIKNRDGVPHEFFTMLRDLPVEEGIVFAQTLLNATDKDFDAYVSAWVEKQKLATQISTDFFETEAQNLGDEMIKEFDALSEEFLNSGKNSAEEFGNGFQSEIQNILGNIRQSVQRSFSNILSGLGSSRADIVITGGGIPQMATGGIFDSPTIVQVGEDGREAIVPLEKNTGWIDSLAQKIMSSKSTVPTVNNDAMLNKLDRIYDRLSRLQIVLDSDVLVGETIDKIDSKLADRQLLTARGCN